MKYCLIGSILPTNRKIDLFCRKTNLRSQMTHHQKAVQDQIKAEISQNLRDLLIWLEIGDNLLNSYLSQWADLEK